MINMSAISSRFLKVVVLGFVLLSGISTYAQATFSVKAKLLDDKSGKPVEFATASLTVKGEKSASKYALSDDKGLVHITKVVKGQYVFKAEIMGYKTVEKEIEVLKSLNIGEIRMVEDAELIDAAKVSAVGNPIVVKKDTIEYNASSFKTSDNDMLENLLKKLPGVEVEADGTITANGETIKKITIDGKTFFLDDPQLASKNIPAKLVEKVKVVEKKSDQAMFTGIDDGEEETIIDLSIRPGMMRGWFGNFMAGGGHDVPGVGSDMNDPRYQGAAMLGRFTDESQISVLLNANNTNNRGFNDVAGSMMQNMRGSRGMGRGMGGWGSNNGITTSWMGGLNGAFTLFDGDMDLSGNYLYNGTDKSLEEQSSKITYLEDGVRLLNDNIGYNRTTSHGHGFGFRMDHKFSENTSLLFEPKFNIGQGGFNEYSEFKTFREADQNRDTTNTGYTSNLGDNDNWSASGFLLLRQRLGKPGRTISANIRYNFSNNDLDGFNQSLTYLKQQMTEEDEAAWKSEIVNQRFSQNSKSTSLSGRLVYTEPLGGGFFAEANYEYGWNRSVSTKDTYDSGSDRLSDGKLIYDAADEKKNLTYSNRIVNRYINQRAGLNISYQKNKFRAQLGASVNPTDTYNETNGEIYSNTVVNWSPQAMLNYEFTDNSNIRVFYFGRSNQPSTSQLMPVPDNSNPVNISFGNPYLKPYFNHNIRGNFGYTNKRTFTSVHARFGGSVVQNAITNAVWTDLSGVEYSIPVNGPGTFSADGRIMVNSPLGKSNFSIFSMTYLRYNESTSYRGEQALSTNYYDKATADFDYDKFHSDFPTLDALESVFTTNHLQTVNLTQRLRFTFRSDIVELVLSGRTRISKSWYTIAEDNQPTTWTNQVDASMNWTVPGGINLIADVDYNWYRGFITPQDDEIILNAEITKLLFKNKFTLALKAYDILNQSKNISVTDAADYHQEVRNNTLGRYVILSLTYRFGNFKGNGRQQGGRPGGHPGGHPGGYSGYGRPMGPPRGR